MSGRELWPRLWHVRISLEAISPTSYEVWSLSPPAFRALMDLVGQVAAGLVWTYTEPGDGSLPDEDAQLARLCRMSARKWRSIRKELEPFFVIRRGRWHLDRDWIEIADANTRFAIPKAIQTLVQGREGRVCAYCGDEEGPFEFDHIFPVARGGSDDPSNLTLACATCNRSKGAKTLREWRG
jgi:5-methylcytosine-specific restriction endonuclease McrA